MGTSSKSSNLTGLTPSNSTGSVIWVGKRNSRAAAAAAAAATAVTSSSAAEVDQPSYYETSVGVRVGGGNYELGEITSTTAAEDLDQEQEQDRPYLPGLPPTSSSTKSEVFEQLFEQQKQQKQSQPQNERSPARVAAAQKQSLR
ncbi:hypothetical protein N0V85_001231 [Neurospora sp. IMI 360204]|nr:hypothetical protein N0V85_001231 [Neurospora sp. IMI 360204]